jgi:hypothetical protein
VKSLDADHKCFGCGKQIQDHEPHIHCGLDEWSAYKGLPGDFGLDDILTMAFCSDCTTDGGPFDVESHEVEA